MRTRVTDLFGIRYPIVQGGLQHLALPGLCAAVSNAGALGQLTAVAFKTADEFRQAIEETSSLTSKPFGVNFPIGRRPLDAHLSAALEGGVKVFSFTGGNPQPMLQKLAGRDVCTMVLVAAVRQAQKAESLGVDAVIAVGFEGGGHIGKDDVGTLVLIPRVVDAVRIPVIASGGIGDGRGLAAALAMGAEGIEMGTRFVATRECLAHPAYKQALVESSETDTTVILGSIGRPGRVLKGSWAEKILSLEQEGITVEELFPYFSGEANFRGAREGNLSEGHVWSGQVTGLIDDVPPVSELIDRIVRGAEASASRLAQVVETTDRT